MTTKEKTEDRLKGEFDYFLEHHDELLKDYNGKHLVIKGEKVVGVYESEREAYFKSLDRHEPGTFLVRLCTPGDEAYTVTFYTPRMTFA